MPFLSSSQITNTHSWKSMHLGWLPPLYLQTSANLTPEFHPDRQQMEFLHWTSFKRNQIGPKMDPKGLIIDKWAKNSVFGLKIPILWRTWQVPPTFVDNIFAYGQGQGGCPSHPMFRQLPFSWRKWTWIPNKTKKDFSQIGTFGDIAWK